MRRSHLAPRARAALVAAATLVAATLVAACGGGGGGDNTPEASPAPAYDLVLIAQSCDSAANGSVVASGTARVSPDANLAGATVLGTFLNDQGAEVAQATSPLPAGSNGLINFSVTAQNSPDITRCIVRFSDGQGNALRVDYSAVQLPADALTPGATPPPGTTPPAGSTAAPPVTTPAQ